MITFILLICSLFCACISAEKATCELVGSVSGTLLLETDLKSGLSIKGTIENITHGDHAIHVHETGSVDNNCADAGGHYNPKNVTHGDKLDKVRHEGDWGNFVASNTTQYIEITDSVAKLSGPTSIMNRAIVIHENADDLGKGTSPASQLNGNAGSRIGCCVIKSA